MLELAGIIILGILSQWIAWRMKIPAILPLIVTGLAVGPLSTFFTPNGEKLLEPIWDGHKGVLPNVNFFSFVSLSIAIILFEGGLTLKRSEIRNTGKTIGNLITLGSLVTFFMAGLASHIFFDLSWSVSFLFSSLIIVTGPTVITPILRNIPMKKDVSTVLKWEGILIDPIGALAAVLVYEFITNISGNQAFTLQAFLDFFKIIIIGSSIGFSFAYALIFTIKRRWVPHYLLNVVSLCMVLLVFVISNVMAHESGLLSVVIMGMVVGNSSLPNLKDLLYFKETLSVLLISILFIMLAANVNMTDLFLVYQWRSLYLFLAVILLIRPLAVFISTRKSNLSVGDKIFISWVGPRGIVAAGVASLFGQQLVTLGISGAEYITPLVFMVVLGTVLLNATTARLFARATGVFLSKSDGVMIIGSTRLSRLVAKYLGNKNRQVVIIDNNLDSVNAAENEGIKAVHANIFSEELEYEDYNTTGYLLATTPNHNVNVFALDKYKDVFGENGYFRLMSSEEYHSRNTSNKSILLSSRGDHNFLSHFLDDFPAMNELVIQKKITLSQGLEIFKEETNSLPFLVITPENKIDPIGILSSKTVLEKGSIISYIGKPIKDKGLEA